MYLDLFFLSLVLKDSQGCIFYQNSKILPHFFPNSSPPSKSHLKIIEILPKKTSLNRLKTLKKRPKSLKTPKNPYKIGNLPKFLLLPKNLQIDWNGKIYTPVLNYGSLFIKKILSEHHKNAQTWIYM